MFNSNFTKKAMVLSVCLLALWAILGTGTTLAWFTDTTPTTKNTFTIGELDLDVFYKNDLLTDYEPVESDTSVFNDQARYEPGYTQVVYLHVVNAGELDFDYKVSVDRYSYVDSVNVLGGTLHLPQYLRIGVMFGDDEAKLTREVAQALADKDTMEVLLLNQYSKTDTKTVPAGGERYVALIVFMPDTVGNEANYQTGAKIPTVELGLTVYAQQAKTQMP